MEYKAVVRVNGLRSKRDNSEPVIKVKDFQKDKQVRNL